MTICRIDPISDERWRLLLEKHPDASIFHSPGWLEALRRTYGYEPVVYATAVREQELVDGIPFCRIKSRLTGWRLVSLPFSDHCQPLVENSDHLQEVLSAVQEDAKRNRCKYVEIRPAISDESSIVASTEFTKSNRALIHRLDLRRSVDDVFRGLSKQCARKIARSGREHVRCEEGTSEDLLKKFYYLLLLTRRRHQLLPQPLIWFRNLINCLKKELKIRVALKGDTPIASIITLSFKNVVTYKYSCSDARFNPLGGTTLLLWRTIEDAIAEGARELDLGRSDYDNSGLIAFKDHWGATRYELDYYSYPAGRKQRFSNSAVQITARRLLATVPDSVFTTLGGLLYPHVG